MPNSATPKLKQFARRLLAHELDFRKPADAKGSVLFHVCEKLRVPLGRLMGTGGFRALLARALALARQEVSSLAALQIKPDGSVEGIDELERKVKASAVAAGEVVLVAHLIGLLVTFIGEQLTLRLLHDIWPEMDDLKF